MTKQESGRSMVEMLGVLAIIGVLSIGGIAGYTIAMNRYRANEILDMAAKVSVLSMAKDSGSTNMTDVFPGISIDGVNQMTGDTNGEVKINFAAGVSDSVVKAINSIAGTKWDNANKTFKPASN